MKTITTSFTRTDTVHFHLDDDAHMHWLASFDSSKYNRFFVIIDAEVTRLWGDLLFSRLRAHNKEIFTFTVTAEESSKSLDFYPQLISFFEAHKGNLSDLVIGVGGGIVLDLVSFSCSTYMRALPFVAIPTTLIGQVDAITAGKTCLNTSVAKNVLGTFYYPVFAYNNIHFLKTNSAYHLRQGYSEIFKYGLLGSTSLLDLLTSHFSSPTDALLLQIMEEAIAVRVKIRKINPLASNLGHTFGHALEKVSGHTILHGDAIAVGTVMALRFAQQQNLLPEHTVDAIILRMQKLGLNTYLDADLDVDAVVACMMRDKKASSTHLFLVLLSGIAQPYVDGDFPFFTTTPDEVKSFLSSFVADYPYKITDCAAYLQQEKLGYD